MNPGHANIGNALNLIAIKLCRRTSFFGNREVAGASRDHRNGGLGGYRFVLDEARYACYFII